MDSNKEPCYACEDTKIIDYGFGKTEECHICSEGGFEQHSGALFNAEEIIAYDLERTNPVSEDIHHCIRKIHDKPHRAPLYISDLLKPKEEPRKPYYSTIDREEMLKETNRLLAISYNERDPLVCGALLLKTNHILLRDATTINGLANLIKVVALMKERKEISDNDFKFFAEETLLRAQALVYESLVK